MQFPQSKPNTAAAHEFTEMNSVTVVFGWNTNSYTLLVAMAHDFCFVQKTTLVATLWTIVLVASHLIQILQKNIN